MPKAVEPFLAPKMIGARFDNHSIPIEFLGDFSVLEELVIEVAKWRFLKSNEGRKRAPRGFANGISLVLTAVEEGSAKPVFSLVLLTATLLPPANLHYFHEARAAIVGAIGAAEKNENVTRYLPEKVLPYFDRFGRSLRDKEAMEFSESDATQPVRLTKETRRRLILSSSAVNEVTEAVTLFGMVPEADQQKRTFQIKLHDRTVEGPIEPQHFETVMDAFNGYKESQRIRLEGIGNFNRNSKLERLVSVERIALIDPLDISQRIDELKRLKPGWLDGQGLAPNPDDLDWFAEIFESSYPDGLPLPCLYPTIDGDVRAEWTIGEWEASLDVSLRRHDGALHGFNVSNGKELETVVSLDTQAGWSMLATQLALFGGPESKT